MTIIEFRPFFDSFPDRTGLRQLLLTSRTLLLLLGLAACSSPEKPGQDADPRAELNAAIAAHLKARPSVTGYEFFSTDSIGVQRLAQYYQHQAELDEYMGRQYEHNPLVDSQKANAYFQSSAENLKRFDSLMKSANPSAIQYVKYYHKCKIRTPAKQWLVKHYLVTTDPTSKIVSVTEQ